jgi:hypothetical protein
LKERAHLEDLEVDRRIILKRTLKRYDWRVPFAFIWTRTCEYGEAASVALIKYREFSE